MTAGRRQHGVPRQCPHRARAVAHTAATRLADRERTIPTAMAAGSSGLAIGNADQFPCDRAGDELDCDSQFAGHERLRAPRDRWQRLLPAGVSVAAICAAPTSLTQRPQRSQRFETDVAKQHCKSPLPSGARLCEPQHVPLQIKPLRVTDPRSGSDAALSPHTLRPSHPWREISSPCCSATPQPHLFW